MRRQILSITTLALLACAAPAAADEKFDAQALAGRIAPHLTEQAIGVARLDLHRFDAGPVLEKVAEITLEPVLTRDLAEARDAINAARDAATQAGARDLVAVFSLGDTRPDDVYWIVTLAEGADPAAVARTMPETGGVAEPLDGAVFFGRPEKLAQLKQARPAERPELAKALEAAGEATAQVAVIPTGDVRRVLREVPLPLPPELGVTGQDLVDGVKWVGVGVNAPPEMSLRLVIQSRDERAAATVQRLIGVGLETLGALPEVRQRVPDFEEVRKVLTPERKDNRLVLELDRENRGVDRILSVLRPPVEEAREAALRSRCRNNLKHFALAMHNFHDRYGSFPPTASFDDDGQKLLSWRVYLLPFLDQRNLYEEFRLDEPWDSEHNKALIERMPEVFVCPSADPDLRKAGKTTYLASVAPTAVFTGEKEGIGIREIRDGTSNTILLVDAAPGQAVVWTKPDDLDVDREDLIQALVGHHAAGFHAAFADGSVRFIAETINPETLKALFTRAGGEVIGELP